MGNKARAAGGKRRRKSLRLTMELPEEVVHKEILTRLPVKSVARFKCVSKSWLSLFSNSQFIKEQFTRSITQKLVDYDCLVARKDEGIYILSRYKETSLLHVSSNDYELIGSLHGLLCLRRRCSANLFLWNPAIHQAKELTLPVRCFHEMIRIGFGYDPVSNVYKVVVCCLCDGSGYAYVYSSNSGSWNYLFIPDYMYPSNIRNRLATPTTIVKDCPYWKYSKYSSDERFKYVFVVKYDVGTNEFKLFPEFCSGVNYNGSRRKRFKLVNLKDNLTLMVYEQSSSNLMVDVYSLDEEEGSWIQSTIYNIRISMTRPTDFVVPRMTQGFEYGGEMVFHKCGKFFCYDQKTDTIKHIPGEGSAFCTLRCYRYTPSLVFLQGMKSVQSQTLSHIFGH